LEHERRDDRDTSRIPLQDFTNEVGALAEEEGHHPDIQLGWGKVKVSLTTHAVKGLSENDFVLAAKIDLL
jgi:4a-hydroxytetrahydrobiopterin dehydratase